MLYNPFVYERKRAILNNRDIDPDISYFNTELTNNCTYLLVDEFNDILDKRCMPTEKLGRFSLVHINCRSLLCNYDEFLDFTCSVNNVFDVICTSETWLTESTDDLINLTGYTFIGRNRRDKRGGGVGVYIKNELKFKVRPDIISTNDSCELIAAEIINEHARNIIVISTYRCPGTDIHDLIDTINNICSTLKNENKFIYWAGDFNIDLLNSDNHKATGDFLCTMMSHALYPAITKPTRITEFSATIIDNVFCNAQTANSFTGILYKNISDHLPIFIISDTEIKRTTEARSVQTREMGANNILNLQKKLQDFDWSSVDSFNDASLAYEHFLSIFKRIFDECCPVRIKKIKHHLKKTMDDTCLVEIKPN